MATRRSYSTAAAPTTLTVGIDNAVTSITVQDGSTYVDGTSGPSVLTIDRGKSNEERILYTSRVGNTFSGLTRGYNGTAAQSHTAGAIVEHTSTQQDFDEANAHVTDATRNDHTQYARVGAVNTFTAAQTVSGANLTANGVALGNVGGGGISGLGIDANNCFGQINGTTWGFKIGGTTEFSFDSTSGVKAHGEDHYFGANAFGAAGTRIHLGSLADPGNAYVLAEGSGADVSLVFRPKGAGNFVFGNTAGNSFMQVDAANATSGNTVMQINYHNGTAPAFARVAVGAADSGGTGRRVLTVPN